MRTGIAVWLVLGTVFLAGCAGGEPRTPDSLNVILPPALNSRIAELESSAKKLREQYNQVGSALSAVEQELNTLRQNQSGKTVTSKEPPPLASPETPAAAAQPPAPPAATSPTPQAEQAVSGLTEDDMKEEPPPPSAAEPPPATRADATSGKGYVVHLTSYRTGGNKARAGWVELKGLYPAQLGELQAYISSFRDGKGQEWDRLHAGLFPDRAAAQQSCETIRKAGGWCEVLPADKAAASPLK